MRGALIKIESNHNNLRTNEVEGEFVGFPEVGGYFEIYGKPLTEGATVRVVTTSTIQEVNQISDMVCEFKTRNSHYRVERIN